MADDYDVRSPAYAGYDDDLYGTSTTERVSDAARDMGGRRVTRRARSRTGAREGHGAGEQAREKASALGEQASEKASALGEQVTDTVRLARRRAGQVSRQTSTQFDHWMQENPLAVGVAAMAAGAVVGLDDSR